MAAQKRDRDDATNDETSGVDSKKIRVEEEETATPSSADAPADASAAASAVIETPPKPQPKLLAAVNGHHPPPQPFLPLPPLSSIGRATASKTYKDGDIVHTNLSYEDEATADPSLFEQYNVSKGLGLYLIVLLVAIVIPNYFVYYSAGANIKTSLTDACPGNEVLFVYGDAYFCADPTTESIVVNRENKFFLKGTGQENTEARDYAIGRQETFAKSGDNFVKTSEGTESVLFSPLMMLYNRLLLQPTEAKPHVYHSVNL